MPSQANARAQAEAYWADNAGFLHSQGENVTLTVSFPSNTNKGLHVRGEADIPTLFARVFGINSWHVSAQGEAQSQVLDIAVVLDISGSMCQDSYPDGENPLLQPYWGPGNTGKQVYLENAVGTSGGNTITLKLDGAAVVSNTNVFGTTSSGTNSSYFGYNDSTRYYQKSAGGRNGMIRIINSAGTAYEYFDIQSVGTTSSTRDEITVTRAQPSTPGGPAGSKMSHSAGAVVQRLHWGCEYAAPGGENGPFQPYDAMIDTAQYFTTLFNDDYDKFGLATYSTDGDIQRTLTSNFSAVTSAMESSYPSGSTNIPYGIALGRQILDGSGKRSNAIRVLVFLTDGVANYRCGGSSYSASSYSGGCSEQSATASNAESHAISEAIRAANGDVIIYTIGLGTAVNHSFLAQIAEIGGGEYFSAPTTAQLDDAFEAIAASTHIALTQ